MTDRPGTRKYPQSMTPPQFIALLDEMCMNRDYLNHALSGQTKDYRQGRAVLRVDDPENTSPKVELLERRASSAG